MRATAHLTDVVIQRKGRDIERFTEGDCWILAQELERAFALPAYAYVSQGVEWPGSYDHHVFVRLGRHRLDIRGIQTPEQMNRTFGCQGYRVKRVDWEELGDDWGRQETFRGSRIRARNIARKLALDIATASC